MQMLWKQVPAINKKPERSYTSRNRTQFAHRRVDIEAESFVPKSHFISPEKLNNQSDDKALLPERFIGFSLLNHHHLTDVQKARIKRISRRFKKPHPLLLSLTQEQADPNELFNIIKHDPEI